MKRRTLVLFGMSALVAGMIACSSTSPATPGAPTATRTTALSDVPADGSTLKVDPAVPLSPINDFIALVSANEADRSLDQLEDEGGHEVFESVTAPAANNPFPITIGEFATILRDRGYRLVEQDPSSGLRLWRRP